MDESQALRAFSALSDPTRLKILRFLVVKGGDGASAGDIGAVVGASSSRASFHLSALSLAGLITPERQSRSIIYRVDFATMGGLANYLIQDCCAGNSPVAACCLPANSSC